ATVFKLATPRTGSARFGQYLVQLGEGAGGSGEAAYEHFLLVLDGALVVDGQALDAGGYAYIPPGPGFDCSGAAGLSTLMWVKRVYEPTPAHATPLPRYGHRDGLPTITTDSGLVRCELLPPEDAAFDFNMSLLAFPPGATLGAVEVHDEEHGLYM